MTRAKFRPWSKDIDGKEEYEDDDPLDLKPLKR
jgi:hypothetical protein